MQIAERARKTGDTTTMFWSERGEVCCATHAPYPGTDTWRWERWRPMKEEEMREWTRQLGRPPKCEACQ
jgi:hypothetical protein